MPDANGALAKTCMLVVDVNGLYKGPNRLEIQNTKGESSGSADSVKDGEKMKTLTRTDTISI